MSSSPDLEVVGEEEDNPIGEPWQFKAKQVADYLGMSTKEVYRIPEEHLPYAKFGRRRRYRRSDVREYARERIQGAV